MGEFLVVAFPNDQGTKLPSFRTELENQIQADDALHRYFVIHDVTQLVDEDLGDCFVVGLIFDPTSHDNVGTDEEDTNDNFEKSGSDIVLEAMASSRVEIWVTSTGAIPLAPSYGWKMETFLCNQDETDSICDRLRTFGLAVVTNANNDEKTRNTNNQQKRLFKPTTNVEEDNTEQMQQKKSTVSSIYSRTTAELKSHVDLLESTVRRNHPHIKLVESAFGFQEYTHRGPGRFEVLFEPTSTVYKMLRDELEAGWIQSVCQYLQSDRSRLRLNISCVYSRPGATDQDWHTDGDHYSHSTSVGDHREHLPYAVCIFVPLIPLTPETGFTRFWPKSHLYPNLLGLARAADALQATIDGVHLQPGDFVMYDYTTWHKGVGNTTNDTERPIVQFLYSCDWYKEKKNYGTQSVFDGDGSEKKSSS